EFIPGVERLGLRFRRRKEDNKQVLIVRDDRECYEFDKCHNFCKFDREILEIMFTLEKEIKRCL
ncbi:MAG: hypothetical protein KAT65_22990, partial [Methanophagales archaeon]|nr:hypothetical protein [Methanophagales archaeon]